MDKKEFYKLLQVVRVFVDNYGYNQVAFENYKDLAREEAWLFNEFNENYQIIRVSFNRAVSFNYDLERVKSYLNYFKNSNNGVDMKFLDIHICNDAYDSEYEPYDYMNVDDNFNDGIDLTSIYPELYDAVHTVSDPNKEIGRIVLKMQESVNKNMKKIPFLVRNPYIVTYITIGICILNYLIGLILNIWIDDKSTILVLLGADYKTFTLCLGQFYRLFTYVFVHNDLIHLICNIYSLYFLGRYIESKAGHLNLALILSYSILCASLTQGILADNTICVGISGGIYGLLVVFLIDVISSGIANIRMLIPTITINLFLNFLSNVAWTAHLGGAIGGLVVFYFLLNKKSIPRILLLVFTILCLVYKYATIDTIKTFFGGTDLNVINTLDSFGLKKYAEKLFIKLINAYAKYGG